ncbi:hypothetical protein Hgul01_04541 [Herpetosiphon gulosus]|uniref:Uncharacterized protein n=1 Tax=Herpetosiphon gulosus TaxID=1973496 RepID=A0ABP9X5R0_9CHLR
MQCFGKSLSGSATGMAGAMNSDIHCSNQHLRGLPNPTTLHRLESASHRLDH